MYKKIFFPFNLMIFSAVFLMINTGVLSAQVKGDISVGARAGINLAFHDASKDFKLGFLDDNTQEPMFNANFVLFQTYSFMPKMQIQVEEHVHLFVGMKKSEPGAGAKVTYTTLDIPVLFRYNFFEKPVRFGVLTGLYFTLPLTKVKTEFSGTMSSQPTTNHNINAMLLGFNLGATAGLPLGPGAVVVDARFLFDLASSSENVPGLTSSFGLWSRRGFIVSAGYEYRF